MEFKKAIRKNLIFINTMNNHLSNKKEIFLKQFMNMQIIQKNLDNIGVIIKVEVNCMESKFILIKMVMNYMNIMIVVRRWISRFE